VKPAVPAAKKPATAPTTKPATTTAPKATPATTTPGKAAAPGAAARPTTAAPSQPPVAPPSAPIVRPAPVGPVSAGMLRLDFRSANIDAFLQAFALAYKWTVVKDPACTGDVTVIETGALDQKRAFQVLQAVLEVRGYTALLDGTILKVMPLKRAVTSTTTVRIPSVSGSASLDSSQVVTEVIPLSSAEAAVLAKDLQPLLTDGASIIGAMGANSLIITDTASNIARIRQVVGVLDKGAGNSEVRIFHMQHVPAKRMADVINELFKQIAPRQPPPPMGPPGQPPQPGQKGPEARPAVAAVEDERSNSVIVVGSVENLKRVEEIIKQLDEELNPHTDTRVYEVKFAEATRLAQLINDGLVGGTGSGGSASQPPPNPFGFQNPFERRATGTQTTSYTIGQTRIVADPRTNSLIITADADMMKTVDQLLDRLDKKVEYASTTFSIQLANANAEDAAYVLGEAFGTSQQNGFNPFFFFGGNGNTGRQSRQDRRIQRRVNDRNQGADAGSPGTAVASGGPASGFRRDDPTGRPTADASRPNLPPGAQELAQFFYDPYYSGGRSRGSDATTGRNQSGQYVNLLQLRGNVLVTPERSTNSLIITTSPENEGAVRDLVAQLDVEVKQVLLEALVAEVTLDHSTKYGLQYIFDNLKNRIEGIFPVLPGAGALNAGLRYTIFRGETAAVLTALSQDDRIRIVSTPRIFTSNNQQAEIDVTDSIPYLRGTTIGFGGQSTTSVDFLDVGLILNVTPRITADGKVTVDVYQEDSNLIDFRPVGNGAVAPQTTQRVTDTSVTLKDGDTLVLSGLQKNARSVQQSKIPILGDIPLIGNLFRSTTKRSQRTELVVFLTPRVIRSADDALDLSTQELKRLQKKVPNAKSQIPPPTPERPEDSPPPK
jgi:general secretion pathway protein D